MIEVMTAHYGQNHYRSDSGDLGNPLCRASEGVKIGSLVIHSRSSLLERHDRHNLWPHNKMRQPTSEAREPYVAEQSTGIAKQHAERLAKP